MDTTFANLKQRQLKWQLDLSKSSLTVEDQEELNSHLDEIIIELTTLHLSADETWLIAMNRIGELSAIEEEFSKVSPNVSFRRDVILLCYGAIGVVFLQTAFILLPTYIYKFSNSTSVYLTGRELFSGTAVLLSMFWIGLMLKGRAILKFFRHFVRKSGIAAAFLSAVIIISSGYLVVQHLDIANYDDHKIVGPAFKTLTIIFYLGLIGVVLSFILLSTKISLRTMTDFGRRINWKSAFILGSFGGLVVTFCMTYRISYLPILIGMPIYCIIGWFASYGKRPIYPLFTAQLFLMGLWLSGISSNFAMIYHFYYSILLCGLIVGFSVGRLKQRRY